MKYQSLLLLFLSAVNAGLAANILVMLPWPWYSHTQNYMPIFKGLAARGHNVTMVSPFQQKKPTPNFNDIPFPSLFNEMFAVVPEQNFVKSHGFWFQLFGFWYIGLEWGKITLENEVMQRIIADTSSNYDLVIVETWFFQETFVAFGHKFNAPVVNLASRFPYPQAAHLTGNNFPTSYVPTPKSAFSSQMTFLERVENLLHYYWDVVLGELYYLREQDKLMRKHFKYPGSENLPPLADMLKNTSLTLMDSCFTVGSIAPFQKNLVEFGGINIKKPEKLPDDLQKFMDNAKEGVVYFSFGSFTDISALDEHVQEALVTTFGKLKRKVIMKLEATNPYINRTKPNILVKQWLPQASILDHPNCKLFITHGGYHSVMEGIHYKVPMLTIPLFSDQHMNSKFLESVGVGITVNLEYLTEASLMKAINTILDTPSYQENVNIRSAIFKDIPGDLLENALYWVEYIIRHKGAPHLRPAVLDLHWYQYLMLDVLAFLLVLLVLTVFIIKFVLTLLYRSIKGIVFTNSDKLKKSNVNTKKYN